MPGCVSCKLDGTAPLSSRPAPAPRPRIGANPFERGLLRPAKCRMLAGERALGSSKCPPGDFEGVGKGGGTPPAVAVFSVRVGSPVVRSFRVSVTGRVRAKSG